MPSCWVLNFCVRRKMMAVALNSSVLKGCPVVLKCCAAEILESSILEFSGTTFSIILQLFCAYICFDAVVIFIFQ